jgi:hypothetical protein
MKKLLRIIASAGFIALMKAISILRRAKTCKGGEIKPFKWHRIEVPKGASSDGQPYHAYLKRGASDKTIVYFVGGGLSWSECTAARPGSLRDQILGNRETFYLPKGWRILEAGFNGLLASNDKRNPFNDWNAIIIPYATADLHVGNNDFPYTGLDGKPHVLCHQGARNLRLSLETLPQLLPYPSRLLICGGSAGAFGCVASADTIAKHWPDCKSITVFADGAQMHYPDWMHVVRDVWKAEHSLYECISGGELIVDWFLRLRGILGEKAAYLHGNTPYDEIFIPLQNKIKNSELVFTEEAKEDYHRHLCEATHELCERLPEYRHFITAIGANAKKGTTPHTMLLSPKLFYAKAEEGISLSEWLFKAANGESVENIGCGLLQPTSPIA